MSIRGKDKIFNLIFSVIRRLKLPFRSRRLLIVKLDAIGDYILFRNCLHYLKRCSVYSDYKFILLGNEAFKSIAAKFESDIVEEFIWVKPEKLRDITGLKRLLFVLRIKMKAVDVLINPVHSRIYWIDHLIDVLGAKIKIGSKGDDVNFASPKQHSEANRYYDELVDVPGPEVFELNRNRAFVKHFAKPGYRDCPFEFGFDEAKINGVKLSGLNIIIFPSASRKEKQWDAGKYSELINLLGKKFNHAKFFLTGGPADRSIAADVISNVSADIPLENLAGRTSLSDLVDILYRSQLLISNETGAVHMAAALNVSSICISNGERFGRFSPYPPDISEKSCTIYPDESFYDISHHPRLVEKYKYAFHSDINLISVDEVYNRALKFIN